MSEDAYSINNDGEVRRRGADGQPEGDIIGIVDRIEDGSRLYQAMTPDREAIGEAELTRTAALDHLIESLDEK